MSKNLIIIVLNIDTLKKTVLSLHNIFVQIFS